MLKHIITILSIVASTASTGVMPSDGHTMYTTDYLNVRELPTTNSKVYKVLAPLEEVDVVSTIGNWDMVDIDGERYFVYDKYITDEEPQETYIVSETTHTGEYLGTYSLTAYCPCSYCCGKSDGITASGTIATAGRTIACNSLPIGTTVYIDGYGTYIVEDTGGMDGGTIDVFFNSHSEALEFGRRSADVYLVR